LLRLATLYLFLIHPSNAPFTPSTHTNILRIPLYLIPLYSYLLALTVLYLLVGTVLPCTSLFNFSIQKVKKLQFLYSYLFFTRFLAFFLSLFFLFPSFLLPTLTFPYILFSLYFPFLIVYFHLLTLSFLFFPILFLLILSFLHSILFLFHFCSANCRPATLPLIKPNGSESHHRF
jgi:hypothetical protein